MIVHPQQSAPPPFELERSHGQHGVRVKDDDLIIVGLLACGTRQELALQLDTHVVAVMPPSAAAARRLLNTRLPIQGQGVTGVLRDGEGAAACDEGHEKGTADVLGEQLAPVEEVVDVPATRSIMQPLARSGTQPRST
jgi:hypothetical protein